MLDEKDSMERVRALKGLARVLEQTENMSGSEYMRVKSLYEMALHSLERMGEDTKAVRERLDKLSKEENSAVTIQEPGDSPP